MTPEEHQMLVETHKLAKANNESIERIRKTNRLSVILRIVYWTVILGVTVGAFYFMQPYIDAIRGAYSGVFSTVF